MLLIVSDGESHLGLVTAGRPVVAGDPDELAVDEGDKGQAVEVVNAGEVLELGLRQRPMKREEAEVDGLVRQAGVQRPDELAVGGNDGPDRGCSAVGEENVGLEIDRVAGRLLRRRDPVRRLGVTPACVGIHRSALRLPRYRLALCTAVGDATYWQVGRPQDKTGVSLGRGRACPLDPAGRTRAGSDDCHQEPHDQ